MYLACCPTFLHKATSSCRIPPLLEPDTHKHTHTHTHNCHAQIQQKQFLQLVEPSSCTNWLYMIPQTGDHAEPRPLGAGWSLPPKRKQPREGRKRRQRHLILKVPNVEVPEALQISVNALICFCSEGLRHPHVRSPSIGCLLF